MNKRILIALILLLTLTTITFNQKIVFTNFNLNKIIIENNSIIKDEEIIKLLNPFYNENLLFLKNIEIENALMKNSFIHSFNIKKQYPNTLKIRIFERKPIAILIDKKKFYLSEKIDLIEFTSINDFGDLPYIIGNKDEFKILYKNLKSIKFPFDLIKKYTLFETNRWDLQTEDKIVIKLPNKNYSKYLINFLELKEKKNFKKYRVFDYRIKDQLILK